MDTESLDIVCFVYPMWFQLDALQCLLGQRSAGVRGTGGVLRELKARWASGLHS